MTAAMGLLRGARPQILFVHDAYPGQFGGIARWLAAEGWQVWAAGAAGPGRAEGRDRDGIRVLRYRPHRPPSPGTHPYAQPFDRAALTAQACVRACLGAREAGLSPDLIVSHAGPGAGMFLRDLFPRAAQVAYCEWWYRHPGPDTSYLAALKGALPDTSPEAAILERSRNLPIATELLAAGQGLCPTRFQAAQFPPALRGLLTVQHDGVDCRHFRPGVPGPTAHPVLAAIHPEATVVSYATRGMEPHRGFPQVMAALAALQRSDPTVVAVVAGTNRVFYGGNAEHGVDWKAAAITAHGLDPARTLFTGMLDPDDYLWLLRRTRAHVYATVPFVLSWSMLEAMATATPLVLSDTAPVREFATEDCARLADLARVESLVEALLDVLADPGGAALRAARARSRIEERHSCQRLFPVRARWFASLCAGGMVGQH